MLDLRKPHEWYPMARALERRLIYHMGPTNSGKTYNALQAMCKCVTHSHAALMLAPDSPVPARGTPRMIRHTYCTANFQIVLHAMMRMEGDTVIPAA